MAPVEENQPKKPWPWKKILIGVGAALIGVGVGAAIGFYVGFPLLVGAAAIAVPAAIGFGLGLLVGWTIPKLIECCCGRHVKQPIPEVAGERRAPALQQKEVNSPRHNLGLTRFHMDNSKNTVVSESPDPQPVVILPPPPFPPGVAPIALSSFLPRKK